MISGEYNFKIRCAQGHRRLCHLCLMTVLQSLLLLKLRRNLTTGRCRKELVLEGVGVLHHPRLPTVVHRLARH